MTIWIVTAAILVLETSCGVLARKMTDKSIPFLLLGIILSIPNLLIIIAGCYFTAGWLLR